MAKAFLCGIMCEASDEAFGRLLYFNRLFQLVDLLVMDTGFLA